jgi:hypothetical protein
MIIENVINNTL